MSHSTSASPSITITHVLEHLYCPRFTYFEHVLAIPERQERRWKVQKGRQVHLERQKVNKSYLRKKLGVVNREFDVPLASERLRVRGVADEVLTLDDGTMAPFDYKFARSPRKPFRNQVMQSALYGLLIAENYGRPVRRGFLCYTRSHHKIETIEFTAHHWRRAQEAVAEIIDVIQQGFLPQATGYRARCRDCCYRNICIQ